MALNMATLSREQMADELGVHPTTVSRWMSDKGTPPHRAYLRLWAEATHVRLDWLETGQTSDSSPLTGGNTSYGSFERHPGHELVLVS